MGLVTCSLRSKRFRGVGERRKSEKQDFRCFCHAKNGARAKKRKEGMGSSPPPLPLSFFGFHPIFCTGKTPKIPFLSLSLLPNPTEMLAPQAKALGMPKLIQTPVLSFRSVAYQDSRLTRLKFSGSLFTLFSFCMCL